jgi:tRNA G46 methylase TrmB
MPFQPELNPYIEKIQGHPQIPTELDSVWEEYKNEESVLDIGCGNGHFLRDYLIKYPQKKGLGIERRFKRTFKTAQKLRDTGSKVVHLTVEEFFTQAPGNFWDEVWLQFPDPWPKSRHEKNRPVNAKLFTEVHRILKPGGFFRFRSDCIGYWHLLQRAHAIHRLFPRSTAYHGDLFADEPRTLFLEKFLQDGRGFYSIEFQK